MKVYRNNPDGSTFLLLGGLAVVGFFVWEWLQNQTQVVGVAPLTSNTTIATQAGNALGVSKYTISPADLSAINNIAVTQFAAQNGQTSYNIWGQAYLLYKGFTVPLDYPYDQANQTVMSAAEFGNFINNAVSTQGLSGLGVIGKNYGPPPNTQPSAGYFGLLNVLSRNS